MFLLHHLQIVTPMLHVTLLGLLFEAPWHLSHSTARNSSKVLLLVRPHPARFQQPWRITKDVSSSENVQFWLSQCGWYLPLKLKGWGEVSATKMLFHVVRCGQHVSLLFKGALKFMDACALMSTGHGNYGLNEFMHKHKALVRLTLWIYRTVDETVGLLRSLLQQIRRIRIFQSERRNSICKMR